MALTLICLDTSSYSHFKRGDPPVVEIVSSAREVGVPVIVLGELRTGFRLGDQAQRNEAELAQFLAHPCVAVVAVTDETASHYADIIADLRRAGTPVPTNGAWIAALATGTGATVVTYDAHFERIVRVGSKILRRA